METEQKYYICGIRNKMSHSDCHCEKHCSKIVLAYRLPDKCFIVRKISTGYTLESDGRLYTAELPLPPLDSDIVVCVIRLTDNNLQVSAARNNHEGLAVFEDEDGKELTIDDESCVLFLFKEFDQAVITVDLYQGVGLPFAVTGKKLFFKASKFDKAIEEQDASVAFSLINTCAC